MHTTRIAELLDPFLRAPITGQAQPDALSTAQLQHISTYIDILIHWNARINLTAIRDPEDIVTRHFGESLFAALHLFPDASESVSGRAALQGRVIDHEIPQALAPACLANDRRPTTNDRLADLGSGAGFPGLPIKIWAPQISLTLIESNHKKAAFLSEVTRALTLTDVDIQNTRAESLPSAAFSVVTLRAVERFESILPTAASLVAPAGLLALLISSAQRSQAQAALPALTWSNPTAVPDSRSRILLIGKLPRLDDQEPRK